LGEAEQVNRAVETRLEQLQKTLARDAALALGVLEHAPELTLEETVDITELLLLVQADGVFGDLAAEFRAVLARRITAAFESFAGAKKVLSEAAADAGGRAGVTSH